MGTIRETIDKSDNVVAAQDYYSYGEYIRSYNQGLSNDRYKFTGKERDNESNLDYFGARYYESSSGRWLQADPLADDHPEESPYVYCSDNPVNIVDDDGMVGHWETDPNDPTKRLWVLDEVVSSADRIYSPMLLNEDDVFSSWTLTMSSGLNWIENKLGVHPPTLVNDILASPPVPAGPDVQVGKEIEKITVLGKFPDYINLSNELGVNRFNIPEDVWNKMTEAEQWNANLKFLNRTIARGDKIILSNTVKNINELSGTFRKELEYLIEKGYKLSEDGTQMIK